MDPALLREREAFKKRALAVPVVEKKKQKVVADPGYYGEESTRKTKPAQPRTEASHHVSKFDYKTASASSNVKFAVLAKIIKHMRARHQQGEDYGLTLEEILDETKQFDVASKIKAWLISEALPINPKIARDREGKYIYNPSFNIRDKNGLVQLLMEYNEKGMGGIFMEEIEESLANAQQVLEEIKDKVVTIKRPVDKRVVIFYKDPAVSLDIPEDIVKLWRSINVEGMDEKKIADYLENHNLSFIRSEQKRPIAAEKKRRKAANRAGKFIPKHNEHVADILQDYSARSAK